jgi:hypothetical protein
VPALPAEMQAAMAPIVNAEPATTMIDVWRRLAAV